MIKLAPCSCRLSLMAFITIAQLALSGCGWQLAGTMPLSPQLKVVHLSNDITHDLSAALAQQLYQHGALLVESSDAALTTVSQTRFDIERRTLTVDSNNYISGYELQGVAHLAVTRSGFQTAQTVSATATVRLNNNITRVIATSDDEAQQTQQLIKELARQLTNKMLRLRTTQ